LSSRLCERHHRSGRTPGRRVCQRRYVRCVSRSQCSRTRGTHAVANKYSPALLNNCHANATCRDALPTYQCTCNTNYRDTDESNPGRKCDFGTVRTVCVHGTRHSGLVRRQTAQCLSVKRRMRLGAGAWPLRLLVRVPTVHTPSLTTCRLLLHCHHVNYLKCGQTLVDVHHEFYACIIIRVIDTNGMNIGHKYELML
jgi:hypothetical protein